MNPLKRIDGWKTEIGICAGLVVGILLKLGYVDMDLALWLFGGIGAWTGVSFKHAIKKRK